MITDGFLYVGDLHVKKSNLPESRDLLKWIQSISAQYKLPVVLAGDQYDDHGNARVEVIEFWVEQFNLFPFNVTALVGNHDMNHEGDATVMVAHNGSKCGTQSAVEVINRPAHVLQKGWGAVPFYRKNEDFTAAVMKLYAEGVRTILCHQEIDGALYENGFYAPHGVKLTDLPPDIKFISGHIHKQQEFANCWYPGAPRQFTRSDAGEQKGIWAIAYDGRRKFIPTPIDICEPFQLISITPETADQVVPDSDKVYLDISGPKDFVLKYVQKVQEGKQNLLHLRTNPDPETIISDIKESDGINVAFAKYYDRYAEAEHLGEPERQELSEMIYRMCPSLKRSVA